MAGQAGTDSHWPMHVSALDEIFMAEGTDLIFWQEKLAVRLEIMASGTVFFSPGAVL